jgi:hypothetical protein
MFMIHCTLLAAWFIHGIIKFNDMYILHSCHVIYILQEISFIKVVYFAEVCTTFQDPTLVVILQVPVSLHIELKLRIQNMVLVPFAHLTKKHSPYATELTKKNSHSVPCWQSSTCCLGPLDSSRCAAASGRTAQPRD